MQIINKPIMSTLYKRVDLSNSKQLDTKIDQFELEVADKYRQFSMLHINDKTKCKDEIDSVESSLALAEHILGRLERLRDLKDLYEFYAYNPESQNRTVAITNEMKYTCDELNVYFSETKKPTDIY